MSLKFIPKGPIDNKSVSNQFWCQTVDKLLPESKMTLFTYTYVHHKDLMIPKEAMVYISTSSSVVLVKVYRLFHVKTCLSTVIFLFPTKSYPKNLSEKVIAIFAMVLGCDGVDVPMIATIHYQYLFSIATINTCWKRQIHSVKEYTWLNV